MVGIVAVAAVTAIAQAYQSEKARGANSAKMRELEQMFRSLVPPEYDVSINEPPQYITGKLKDADLDFSRISPEQFKVMGTYAPQAAAHVAEINPTLVQQTAVGQEGRQSQIDALRNFRQIAQGNNPELQASLEAANRAAQTDAQSRMQSLLQDAQRRGSGGSGTSFAAMLQGNSDSMLRGAQAGRDGALEAYRSKLEGVRQSGAMGRQLAQDEFGAQQTNADIINQFNQRTSRSYQDYENNRANLANQAQMYNLDRAQATADKNVSQNNQAAVQNQQNRNQLAQQQYGNARDERNTQNDLAQSRAIWAAQEKERQNNLKSKTYNDQLGRTNGMAGLGSAAMQQNNQNAANTNAMIGAVGSSAAGYMASTQNQEFLEKQRLANQKAEDARAARAQAAEDTRQDKYNMARGFQ